MAKAQLPDKSEAARRDGGVCCGAAMFKRVVSSACKGGRRGEEGGGRWERTMGRRSLSAYVQEERGCELRGRGLETAGNRC